MRFSNIRTHFYLSWMSMLMLIPVGMKGQSTVLDRYVEEGIANNLQIAKQQLAIGQQQLRIEEAKAKYLPSLRLQANYLTSSGGRLISFPLGDLLNPAYGALNEITGSNSFPTLDNQSFQLTPINYLDARLYLSQPIFNTAIKQNKLAQSSLKEMEEAQMEVFVNNLRKDIKVSYLNFLKTYEVLAIYDSTEILLREVLSFNEKLVRYDKATVDATANVELELAKLASDRAMMLQQQAVAQAYFNTLLNRELNSSIQIDSELVMQQVNSISLVEMYQRALASRQELQQLDAAIKANESLTKLNQQAFLPSLGLEASAGYQNEDDFFSSEAQLATVGLGLTWNIFEGGQRKKRVQQSQIESAKLLKDKEMVQQQIQLQLINAWHAVIAARRQMEADQVAVKSAETVFDITNKRYRNEQALLIEYLDARTKLTQANITQSISKFDYVIRQVELEAAVGNN